MESNRGIMSARIRKPSTGRRNDVDIMKSDNISSNSSFHPNNHHRTDKMLHTRSSSQSFPAILPMHEDPTIPPISDRKSKVLSCPETWIDHNKSSTWLEKATVGENYDYQAKQAYTRAFIERNQHQLWKYDAKYKEMSPRSVCDDIVNSKGFVTRMRTYQQKEQAIPLTTSRHMSDILHGCRYVRDSKVDYVDKDPYLMSLTTSRHEKDARINHLFLPNTYRNTSSTHRKGYNHAPEYGNFSRFCSVMKSNEGATLKR